MQTKESLPPHWQHIKDLYIAGFPSIRELARKNGVSDTAIHKKAKAEGWARPGVRKPPRKPIRKLAREPERETLPRATASEVPAAIVAAADADPSELIKETRFTLKLLHDMLRWETRNIDWLEEVIREETAGDRTDRRREVMEKAVSMPVLILAAKNLALALKTLTDAGGGGGKKQQAQEAADSAGEGTSWGDDLNIGVTSRAN